jgi:hypothetical protein
LDQEDRAARRDRRLEEVPEQGPREVVGEVAGGEVVVGEAEAGRV